MKTSLTHNKSIEENLSDPDFVNMLKQHPLVQAKVKQTKKNLGLAITDKKLSSSK